MTRKEKKKKLSTSLQQCQLYDFGKENRKKQNKTIRENCTLDSDEPGNWPKSYHPQLIVRI